MRPPSTDLQQLLAEEPFVRALAAQLLADEPDDVVQQTFVQALQHRPTNLARPRSWLARLVRNLVSDQRRQRRNRAEREHRAALADWLPSAAELVQIEERRRALVDAVNQLPSLLRTVVLLRYYEGLPPRRIAAELDLQVTVVWERLRAALQQLRRRLDAAHGDERRAWLLPLVHISARPLTLPWRELVAPAKTAWNGVLAMTMKTKLATIGAGLLALAILYTAWPRATEPLSTSTGDRSALVANADRPDRDAQASASLEREAIPEPLPIPVVTTLGGLLVRVCYADEPRPAADVPVILNRPGQDFRVDVVRGRTDETGTARFDALAIGNWEVTTGRALGPSTVEIQGSQVTECNLDLKRGLTLTGIVVDATGSPVAGALVEVGEPYGRDPEVLTITGRDGTFVLRACRRLSLIGARAEGYASSSLQTCIAADGTSMHVRLELVASGGVVEGLVVDSDGTPVGDAVIRIGDGRTDDLFAFSGSCPPVPAQVRTNTDGTFRAIGVPVGAQPVQARAVGFAPWRGSCEVTADLATAMRVTLAIGAICKGTVVTEVGTPVPDLTVQVGAKGDFVQLFARTGADGAFTLRDLPAGEVELAVADHTRGKGSAKITAVPGAIVHCELRLSSGQELHGRVVDDADQPVADIDVQVAVGGTGERRVEHTRSDRDGRFHVPFLPSGCRVTVKVSGQTFDPVRKTDIDPAAGEVLLRLQTPARSARIRGVVVGVDGKPAGNLRVDATWRETGGGPDVITRADGSFEVGPLRTGSWRLRILIRDCAEYCQTVRLAENQTVDLGTIRIYRGGTLLAKVIGAEPAQLEFVIYDDRGELIFGMVTTNLPLRSLPLRPGDYELRVRGKGFAAQPWPFSIRDGAQTELEVVAAPGIRQRFDFQVAAGDAAPGWFVFEVRRGGAVVLSGVASSSDQFTVEHWLAPGDYEVAVKADDLHGGARFTVGREPGVPIVVVVH